VADAEEKARRERIIFQLFAEVAGLPTRSVENRPVPAPDMLCEVNGEGLVAFELGEVVHAPLIERTNQSHALNHRFAAEYTAMPEAAHGAKIPVWNIPTLEDVVLEMEVQRRIESHLGGAPGCFRLILRSARSVATRHPRYS
jgi:hypothetical protein